MSVLQSFDLSGKTALVTDCKRGIRKAMVIALAASGASTTAHSAACDYVGASAPTVSNIVATEPDTRGCRALASANLVDGT